MAIEEGQKNPLREGEGCKKLPQSLTKSEFNWVTASVISPLREFLDSLEHWRFLPLRSGGVGFEGVPEESSICCWY